MIPGKMNTREMKRMMQQMGIKSTDMPEVKRVVMEADGKKYIIDSPQVVAIEAQGQKSFQITGNMRTVKVVSASQVKEKEPTFPAEDIKLVMDQTSCTSEEAMQALKKANGEPAEAIMSIISEKGTL
jgi:nascent polypeptide-associated complex subunit alpha